jgi:hypothetical protein
MQRGYVRVCAYDPPHASILLDARIGDETSPYRFLSGCDASSRGHPSFIPREKQGTDLSSLVRSLADEDRGRPCLSRPREYEIFVAEESSYVILLCIQRPSPRGGDKDNKITRGGRKLIKPGGGGPHPPPLSRGGAPTEGDMYNAPNSLSRERGEHFNRVLSAAGERDNIFLRISVIPSRPDIEPPPPAHPSVLAPPSFPSISPLDVRPLTIPRALMILLPVPPSPRGCPVFLFFYRRKFLSIVAIF